MFEQLKENFIDRTAQQSEMLATLSRHDFGMIAEISEQEEITMTDAIFSRIASECKERREAFILRCQIENDRRAK